VIPTSRATSLSVMSGSCAMRKSTCVWLVRNVQELTVRHLTYDSDFVYFLSRYELRNSYIAF
jgi:hypothetical protein